MKWKNIGDLSREPTPTVYNIKQKDVWRDPKVELPKSYNLGAIGSGDILATVGNAGGYIICQFIENDFCIVEFDNWGEAYIVKKYTDIVTKWSYIKDLIKQERICNND